MRPMNPSAPAGEQSAQLENFIRKMENLVRTDGWKMLEAVLQQREDIAFSAMVDARSGDEALRASAVYTTLKTIRELPVSEMKKAGSQLQVLAASAHRR